MDSTSSDPPPTPTPSGSTGIERPTAPSASVDFDQTPLLVIWETTQACGLSCRHCRADARDWRSDRELSTDEGRKLIDQVAELGTKVMVLSGGDPLRRDDLEDLISHGVTRGLRMCTIPAVTGLLTPARLESLRDAGVAKVAFSLDGADASSHDGMRRVAGTFDRTMEAMQVARELGVELQVNTLVHAGNLDELDAIAALVEQSGADMWELMFLIPVGRGKVLPPLGPEGCERAFDIINAIEDRTDVIVKVTEAPHYRRYRAEHGHRGPMHRVNAGRGFVFISHAGDVFPSGFLPFGAGDVRSSSLVDIYRSSHVMRAMRDTSRLQGACGDCSWRSICGGSRSRAYAVSADVFAPEPWCRHAVAPAPAAGAHSLNVGEAR